MSRANESACEVGPEGAGLGDEGRQQNLARCMIRDRVLKTTNRGKGCEKGKKGWSKGIQ